MTLADIRRFRNQQPFRPIEIVMVDRKVFRVSMCEAIWVPPGSGKWIFVVDRGRTEHVHVSRIKAVRLIEPAKRAQRDRRSEIEMTTDKLREVMRNQPFRPFLVHLADGRAINVEHPDFIAISPSGRTAIIYTKDDASHFIDLLLVTDLEVKPEKRRSNGQRRRKAG